MKYVFPYGVQGMSLKMTNCNVRNITSKQYKSIELAFDALNKHFFSGQLPDSLIVLHRLNGARGYFRPNSFRERGGDKVVTEISLNPETFDNRTDEEIFGTLLHEMVHAKQHQDGTASRGGYHNGEFAREMERCGLITSDTGEPGGKRVGRVTHYIQPGGAFEKFIPRLKAEGIEISWQAAKEIKKEVKSRNKTKYTCPECQTNTWGAPGLNIICGDCGKKFEEVGE